MKHLLRLTALCLCLTLLAGLFPAIAPATVADAAMYTSYTTIAKIGTHGGCNAMQGMDVDGSYIYCAKIDSETETTCSIGRVNKTTGETVWLTNSATGTYYFSQLAHANDLAVCTINGVKTLFVGTGGAGKGDYSLVRFSFNGTTLKEEGHYNMKHSGTEKYIAGVKVVATSPTDFTLVLKQGNHVYTATIPYSTTSGDIAMNYLGKLDFSAVNFGGTIKDLSNYVQQGFGYKDNKLFVPMTANYQTSTSHISTIVCFDIDGMKGGNLKPDPNMSVWIEDTTYPDLFEIESCAICPTDGKLYFATNCRKSSTDGNHDGVHVLNSFVYSPAMGDSTTGQNYYFHTSSNKLQSVTTANSVFNSALRHLGTVSGNKISGGVWSIDMPIILKHDQPWIVTWEGSNWTDNGMLLSTYDTSPYPNNYYLYRCAGSSLVALGYCSSGGSHHNYGVDLADHGIDDTVDHKYQLKNVVNADGTNMVYLWVDGTNLGAMNNYHFGSTSQGKTDNWVSGKDFSFSYFGTAKYPISGKLKYLKVWTQGNINAFDEPSVFRWETQNDQMTPISQFGYTTNPVTVLGGSCTNGTYSDYYDRLEQPVVLMHDRPWVMEWKTPSWSGNTMLFSSGDTAWKLNASYLYRSTEIVAFGYSDGAKAHSYGIKLSDHGISATDGHTYRLTNKIDADGSNMVYLSVDGQELGPMDRYHLGNDYQGTTSDFVSGKDFTFPYMGNYHYGLNQAYDYIQVWENGIPADDPLDRYRWEGSGSSFKNITTNGLTPNTANRVVGKISGGVFDEATYRLDTPIVLQHDKPWSVSWASSGTWAGSAGGAFLLSASQTTSQTNAPYLYRRKDSGMIGFGIYTGTHHVQYGLQLSDFGIDGTLSHTYTLTNRINADGSNMIYLSVDGVELGAMDHYFIGAAPQGTTSDFLSGKDFTFRYLGTPRFPLSNVTLSYLEVDEGTHTHSYGEWAVTEAATCTTDGSQTRTCTGCGETETQTIAATGHSYNATVTSPDCTNGGHTAYTCTVCGDTYQDSITEATGHSYVDGVCTACGEADPDAVTQPTLTLKYPSLSFEAEILYNVYYVAENIDDVVEMGLLTFDSEVADGTIDNATDVIEGFETDGSIWKVGTNGISAKNLGDDLYFMVYAELSDGSYVYSAMKSYSAVSYANTILGRSTSTDYMKSLVVAMLNYGTEAQLYFEHRTDSLMNASLTAEQQALVGAYDESMMDSVVSVDSTKAQNFLYDGSSFTRRAPSVSFDGAFSINYYFTAANTPDDGMTLYYWNIDDYLAADVLTVDNATGSMEMVATDEANQYWGNVTGIAAKELDQTVFVVGVYEHNGTTYTTGVLNYSIGKYCEGIAAKDTSDQQAFAQATAVYGYCAKEYFANL